MKKLGIENELHLEEVGSYPKTELYNSYNPKYGIQLSKDGCHGIMNTYPIILSLSLRK